MGTPRSALLKDKPMHTRQWTMSCSLNYQSRVTTNRTLCHRNTVVTRRSRVASARWLRTRFSKQQALPLLAMATIWQIARVRDKLAICSNKRRRPSSRTCNQTLTQELSEGKSLTTYFCRLLVLQPTGPSNRLLFWIGRELNRRYFCRIKLRIRHISKLWAGSWEMSQMRSSLSSALLRREDGKIWCRRELNRRRHRGRSLRLLPISMCL